MLNALLHQREESFPVLLGMFPPLTGSRGHRLSKQAAPWLEHILQIRQDPPCLNQAVEVTHLQACEVMMWSAAPWQHRVHTGVPGSQKAGALWGCLQLCWCCPSCFHMDKHPTELVCETTPARAFCITTEYKYHQGVMTVGQAVILGLVQHISCWKL